MADEQRGRVLGTGPCPNCGNGAAYKVNKKGHLYVYCVVEADGGCLSGTTSRSAKGDRELAKRITKWANKEDRARLLGEGGGNPKQESKTASVPWWEKEII
jgi:hypothetical protein